MTQYGLPFTASAGVVMANDTLVLAARRRAPAVLLSERPILRELLQ